MGQLHGRPGWFDEAGRVAKGYAVLLEIDIDYNVIEQVVAQYEFSVSLGDRQAEKLRACVPQCHAADLHRQARDHRVGGVACLGLNPDGSGKIRINGTGTATIGEFYDRVAPVDLTRDD